MAKPPPLQDALKRLRQTGVRASDLQGAARLATQATVEVSRVVEGVHQAVRGTLGLPASGPGQTGGLTGLIYSSVRGVTRAVDLAAQLALKQLEPWLDTALAPPPEAGGSRPRGSSLERDAVLAALNGVMGDRLEQAGNPLATRMGFYQQGRPLDLPALARQDAGLTNRVLLLVHGLCMNDQQWEHDGHDHGRFLAESLGYTPIYLRYNTGRHTSQNGRELAAMLEALLKAWPLPVEHLAIVAHSMGGLVTRSACQAAQSSGYGWLGQLRHLVCLGTPHHGAPLERAGHGLELLLGVSPYSRPLAQLARLRSAGITDLRYGHVQDGDWQGRDRFRRHPDRRQPLPLPEGVACYTVAGTLAGQRSPVAERLLGDGLVPLPSALGQHEEPPRSLAFPKNHCWVAYRVGHMALLSDAGVASQLQTWLAPSS